MLTMFDLVWMAAERAPDHLAIVDDRTERRLSYRQLIDEIEMVATGPTARSINYGMRVATVLPSTFDHCIALLALAQLGAVPALINFRLRPKDIARFIADKGWRPRLLERIRNWPRLSRRRYPTAPVAPGGKCNRGRRRMGQLSH